MGSSINKSSTIKAKFEKNQASISTSSDTQKAGMKDTLMISWSRSDNVLDSDVKLSEFRNVSSEDFNFKNAFE